MAIVSYRCPVCHKKLTKKEYESALGILKERESYAEHKFKHVMMELKEAQYKVRKAKKEGIEIERTRNKMLLEGQAKKIQILKERLKQVQNGATPQTEGLEFEDVLTKRLQKEFPEDKITHTGWEHKGGGDILQTVMYEGKSAGNVVYECKRTPRWQNSHVEQAYKAKVVRKADFAVLVTTSNPKRGWNGFGIVKDVLITTPLAVIPIVKLLRQYLIEMLKAEIPAQKRAKIAQQLLVYIKSPEYRNPIEEIAREAEEVQEELRGEIKSHFILWKRRAEIYNNIRWDVQSIHNNVQRILQGKEIKPLNKPKPKPLQLPSH